jgi:hypothetical protein
MPGSKAAAEMSTIRTFVMMAASHASLSIEDGGDHLIGLAKLSTEPVSTTACFTCIRSMLETCAIGAWLVDPTVDASERKARIYAFKRAGMQQCRKFATAIGDVSQSNDYKKKIEQLENEASACGYS